MTDEELKRYTGGPLNYMAAGELLAEIGRLKGLIEEAEREGEDRERCPWCGAWRKNHPMAEPHAADCPAFNPDGTVK